jgi:pyruvate carboxylase subunit B
MKYEIEIDDHQTSLDIDEQARTVSQNGENQSFSFWQQTNGRYLLRVGNKTYTLDNAEVDGTTITFTINGQWITAQVSDEQDLLLEKLGFRKPGEIAEGTLKAPMPGKILDVMVSEGDQVSLDQPVVILEAMKMENELKAPSDGVVKSVYAHKGDSINKNAVILEIEAIG